MQWCQTKSPKAGLSCVCSRSAVTTATLIDLSFRLVVQIGETSLLYVCHGDLKL